MKRMRQFKLIVNVAFLCSFTRPIQVVDVLGRQCTREKCRPQQESDLPETEPITILTNHFLTSKQKEAACAETQAPGGLRLSRSAEFIESVQHQRIFLVTTSAEIGRPSWILRHAISPYPISLQ